MWHVPEETSNTVTYCRWWQFLITSSLWQQQIIKNAKFYILNDSSTFEPFKSNLRKWMWRSTVLRRLPKLTKFDYECLSVWSSDLDKLQLVEYMPTMPKAIGMPTTAHTRPRHGMHAHSLRHLEDKWGSIILSCTGSLKSTWAETLSKQTSHSNSPHWRPWNNYSKAGPPDRRWTWWETFSPSKLSIITTNPTSHACNEHGLPELEVEIEDQEFILSYIVSNMRHCFKKTNRKND